MSRHAVTLTFDTLTLSDCSVSAVTCSNAPPNYSEIEKSAAELSIIDNQAIIYYAKAAHKNIHNKKLIRDEIANVNFLYHEIDSCINSATDWRGYMLLHGFTKFSEITQCNGHYAVQSQHFGTNRNLIYDFLLVINTNLPPILHRFQLMSDYWSNFR